MKTGIYGNLVILDPYNLNGFNDCDAVIRSVPEGGTLLLLDDYVISEAAGRPPLHFPYACTLQGTGIADVAGGEGIDGCRVLWESSLTDEPAVQFKYSGRNFSRGWCMRNIGIRYRGEGYAFVVDNVQVGIMDGCMLSGRNSGYRGIGIFGSTMQQRFYRTKISKFQNTAFYDDGVNNGGDHVIADCHFGAKEGSAVHIRSSGWNIRGGEYTSQDSSGIHAAIRLEGAEKGMRSTVIDSNVHIELKTDGGMGILIDGREMPDNIGKAVQNLIISNVYFSFSTYSNTTAIKVDKARDVLIKNPMVRHPDTRPMGLAGCTFAEFTENALDCVLVDPVHDLHDIIEDNGRGTCIMTRGGNRGKC